jgi:hypothetical protein
MDKASSSMDGKKPRLFIGFKLYPNLGYKPLDSRLPALEKLYGKCIDKDIPILVHGSPGGAFTHDRPLYYAYDRAKNDPMTVAIPELDDLKGIDKSVYYFMQEYSSPHAWKLVLDKFKKLRLCIAHFCGSDDRPDSTVITRKALSGWNVPIDPNGESWDTRYWNQQLIALMQQYDNLHTDLSCHEMDRDIVDNLSAAIVRWPELRKRILFGTDWYMTVFEGINYKEFSEQMHEAIDTIDEQVRVKANLPENDPPLWRWITEINPFRFYRFDRIAREYTKELERGIKADQDIKKKDRTKKINFLLNQKTLIYAIANKLKELGELPDAVTND